MRLFFLLFLLFLLFFEECKLLEFRIGLTAVVGWRRDNFLLLFLFVDNLAFLLKAITWGRRVMGRALGIIRVIRVVAIPTPYLLLFLSLFHGVLEGRVCVRLRWLNVVFVLFLIGRVVGRPRTAPWATLFLPFVIFGVYTAHKYGWEKFSDARWRRLLPLILR